MTTRTSSSACSARCRASVNQRLYVDYWWFYRYNDFQRYSLFTGCAPERRVTVQCSDHEGDWEGVTAVTEPNRDDRLSYVGFGQHERVYRFDRDQLDLHGARCDGPTPPKSPLLQPRAGQPWCTVRWLVSVCDCPPGARDPLDLLPGVDCDRPALLVRRRT